MFGYSVMGLKYNKNILYPRPITLAKDICGFIGVIGLTCLIELVRFFLYLDIYIYIKTNSFVIPDMAFNE